MNKTAHILIIEDDVMLQSVLKKQFENHGHLVATAGDGEEGLALMLTTNFDAIILDIVMPKKDGIEVLKEYRQKAPDSKVPIIVLSNANQMEYVAGAMASGAAAYLIKSDQQLSSIVNLVTQKIEEMKR